MLRFTVRFDRYTQDNEDDTYANERFHYIPDPARRLLEQMRSELGQQEKLAGLWDTYHHVIVHENLFCVWIGFNWHGTGPDFFRTMQETYDVHGMSGFYDVLDFMDLDPKTALDRDTGKVRRTLILEEWCKEADDNKIKA